MSLLHDRCPACFVPRLEAGGPPCGNCGYDEAAPARPLVLPPGTVLADHLVVGTVLGEPGGFGITYLGWDGKLETRVAIKEFLPRDLATRAQDGSTVVPISESETELFAYGLRKFLQEARTLARFDHPNVVRVRTFFEANASGYLVMDYYEGVTLSGHLGANREPMREEIALGVMLPVLDGLREIHAQDVLHRDIKPQNIYLTTTGRAILLDFGAARVAMNERSRSLSVVLTPGFAPYEQYHRSGRQGPWTDVYACAATLYWMLTGRTPPEATERLVNDELRPPRELRPELSPEVDDALLRGLAVEPDRRLQGAREFQDLLLGSSAAPAVHAAAPRIATPRLDDAVSAASGEGGRAAPSPGRTEPARTGRGAGRWTARLGRRPVAAALAALVLAAAGVWGVRSWMDGTDGTPDDGSEAVAVSGDGDEAEEGPGGDEESGPDATPTDDVTDGSADGGGETADPAPAADDASSDGGAGGPDAGGETAPPVVAGDCSVGATDRAIGLVRDQLASAEREIATQLGIRAARSPYCARLTPGDAADVTADLEAARRYIAVSVCDDDCGDVDIEMRDPGSLVLAADRDPADLSFVMFAAPVTGRHRARVRMTRCDAPYCAYGLALYELTDADPWAEDVRTRMGRVARDAEPEVGIALALPVRVGYLWQGAVGEMSVRLESDRRYVVLGLCDEDCDDLDLAIDDGRGRTLDSDVAADETPVLELTPPRTGIYWIRPTMYACADEPCRYAIGLFTKAAS